MKLFYGAHPIQCLPTTFGPQPFPTALSELVLFCSIAPANKHALNGPQILHGVYGPKCIVVLYDVIAF